MPNARNLPFMIAKRLSHRIDVFKMINHLTPQYRCDERRALCLLACCNFHCTCYELQPYQQNSILNQILIATFCKIMKLKSNHFTRMIDNKHCNEMNLNNVVQFILPWNFDLDRLEFRSGVWEEFSFSSELAYRSIKFIGMLESLFNY